MVKKLFLSTIFLSEKCVFHFSLILLAALFLYTPIAAYAGADAPPHESVEEQLPPVQENVSDTSRTMVYGTPVAILPSYAYYVSFMHSPNISESAFTMRIAQYGVVSGCIHLQKDDFTLEKESTVKTKYLGERMEFVLDMPVIALNDGEPRYSNYDCETSHLESYIDVRLDRDELLQKGIRKFSYKTSDYDFGSYEIDLTKERLIFKGKNATGVGELWRTLWFFPKESLKLYVSGAKADLDLVQEIRDFGLARGLIPMDKAIEGYIQPYQEKHSVYFTDPRKIYMRDLTIKDDKKEVGSIGVNKTYYGPDGTEDHLKALPIHAALVLEQIVR
ncbi:MAG: hypothetical protein KAJ40_05105 [Alphaproteobacteria bacterium]|nr:hypothetical protein [Alphaproteobacteria bacterium]